MDTEQANNSIVQFLAPYLNQVEKLEKEKEGMVRYLLLKVDAEDWHGVADAAMDIREIEAKIKTYNEVFERL